eukprot:Gregarina_sp_Poly_1__10395@NODE_746_length_6478_cov_51_732491_g556_i0_p4_GENE_NODE_746_length_6478_cov_51_732491_g556_i0NODE_746_length_6478_cov_51_732491_g556_i0_p4_ORF_typecomplete_len308_score38_06Laminin_G_2/PF02210_24/0_086_NODE_746_length_6478_cov_51_732491_g556_i030283951
MEIKVVSVRDRHQFWYRELVPANQLNSSSDLQQWILMASAQTEVFPFGTIGVLSSAPSPVVVTYLDVMPYLCKPLETYVEPPPRHLSCSTFNETYISTDINKNWQQKDPVTSTLKGAWRYFPYFLTEPMVIAQLNAVNDAEHGVGSRLILKNHIVCYSGQFRVSYFAQCPKGRFSVSTRINDAESSSSIIVEFDAEGARMSKMIEGRKTIIANLNQFRLNQNAWTNVEIEIERNKLFIEAGKGGTVSLLSSTDFQGTRVSLDTETFLTDEEQRFLGGRVGVGVHNCGGIALKDISLARLPNTLMASS